MGKKLLIIFLLALTLRLLYFPHNINFAYDQARDAFISLRVASGDLVIVGPPSTFFGIHHGALFYYLFAPIYKLFNGSPAAVTFFLRVVNATGVFLVYKLAKTLFDRKTGSIAALIYALSFEQTQFAILLGHPSLAVTSGILFYLGLSLFIFQKKNYGILITAISLALSIQFHFSMVILTLPLFIFIVIFREKFFKLDKKTLALALFLFSLFASTLILTELKYDFKNTRAVISLFQSQSTDSSIDFRTPFFILERYFQHNILLNIKLSNYLTPIFIFAIFHLSYRKSKQKYQVLFLFVWLTTATLAWLPDEPFSPRYTNSMGASVSLVILIAFLISKLKLKLALIALLIITFSNLELITKTNFMGFIPEPDAQGGMLLGKQKEALDYIYNSASGAGFSVNAISVPYNVNTTWSYLFEWYGKNQFGYLPLWTAPVAKGFEGNLEIIDTRSDGPEIHFTIIEPSSGLFSHTIDNFLKEEDYFTRVVDEQKFGRLKVQKRIKI